MRIGFALLALVGCYAPSVVPGAPCSEDGFCPAGQMCYSGRCYASPPIDDAPIDGDLDAAVDACGANVCQGGDLVGCGVNTTCTYGCISDGVPHCARIKPSNALPWSLVPFPGGTLTLASGTHVFDTTAGTLTTNGNAVALPSAVTAQVFGTPVQMMVLALGDLELQSGATLTVTGTRPLAILADGNVTVASGAAILLGGRCSGSTYDPTCGGPAGGKGGQLNTDLATGCGAGQNGATNAVGTDESGGGGGGFGRAGAPSIGVGAGQGRQGDACGNSNLEPLLGGSGGGAGGMSAGNVRGGGRGGGGGGAMQITASERLDIQGLIDAGGAGGENGYPNGSPAGTTSGGGGGGGSGGGLLLEAGNLVVTGSVTANGGAGGGHSTTIALGHGENGRTNRTCAVSNASVLDEGTTGGRGDCDATPGPGNGGAMDDRGGGGGGVGRIRFNGFTTTLTGATISGSQTTGPQPTLE